MLDTEKIQWLGWSHILKSKGIHLSKQAYCDYSGKTGKQIEEELIRKFKLNTEPGLFQNKKRAFVWDWLSNKKIKPMPYAIEAVEFFKSIDKEVGLVSNGPKTIIMKKLERTNLNRVFKTIASIDDVDNGKPCPDIYLFASKQLGVSPGQCLVFEDTVVGVRAAKSAGMICVAIPNEFSINHDFSISHTVCKNMKEAVEYVKTNFDI